jgi:nitrate reductase gamma subunit
MLYSITFNLALAVFTLGTVYRVGRWFTVKVGPDAGQYPVRTRVSRAFKSLFSVFFNRNILRLTRAFFFQVIFQGHILKKDPLRWLMHFTIFAGILLLVLFHALDDQITTNLFSDYYSTVNPFLFLRNLFGAMVLAGIAIAGCRRLFSKGLKQTSTSHDVLALVLLSIILLSGFVLEGSQIISEPVFDEMGRIRRSGGCRSPRSPAKLLGQILRGGICRCA